MLELSYDPRWRRSADALSHENAGRYGRWRPAFDDSRDPPSEYASSRGSWGPLGFPLQIAYDAPSADGDRIMTTLGLPLVEPARPSQPTEGGAKLAGLIEFLAVGGATLLLFPLAWVCRAAFGLDASELAVGFLMFHGAHLINDPHFSVTYLLFYRDVPSRVFGEGVGRAQRARYLFSAFVVPAVLVAWALLALTQRSAPALGWMMELMFFLVGWHYVKQGFGVLVVLSARRGVLWSAVERRIVLAHCFAAWAYAWASPANPSKEVEEKGVVYRSLSHGIVLEHVTFVVFCISGLAVLWVLMQKQRRADRALPLAPLCGLFVTSWLWTVYSHVDPLMVYVIPALHSVQYLYFVWLMRRNQAREKEGPPTFGRPAALQIGLLFASAVGLGWILFHGAPNLLDAAFFAPRSRHTDPGDLGVTPCFAAFYACVNIHHYFMDHVIWRRENPETRYLYG